MRGKIIAHGVRKSAVERQAALPPCGRNDVFLDRITLHAVEGRRFVGFIQNAHGYQDNTGAQAVTVGPVILDVRLLDFHFARPVPSGNGVLDFHFAVEAQPVVKIMTEKQHEAV